MRQACSSGGGRSEVDVRSRPVPARCRSCNRCDTTRRERSGRSGDAGPGFFCGPRAQCRQDAHRIWPAQQLRLDQTQLQRLDAIASDNRRRLDDSPSSQTQAPLRSARRVGDHVMAGPANSRFPRSISRDSARDIRAPRADAAGDGTRRCAPAQAAPARS